jgi:hypothetical protein
MENEQFDDLTRHLGGAGSSRRQTLRALGSVLLGGTLGSVAARLGLGDVAEAKKKRKEKPNRNRQSQAERKARGQLQAEGKRKGKGKGKQDKRNRKPPGCTGEFCDNGGRCCGGSCVAPGACCPGEKPCGGGCIAETSCCPYYEKECGGECIPTDECCELTAPLCTGECEEEYCDEGEWICIPKETPICGRCERQVCAGGNWQCLPAAECPPGKHLNPDTCKCEVCGYYCDPETDETKMFGCKAEEGERCSNGSCRRACPTYEYPDATQLCCGGDPAYGVDCHCFLPDFSCNGRCGRRP